MSIERFARAVLEHDEPHLPFVSVPVAVNFPEQFRLDVSQPLFDPVFGYIHLITLIENQSPTPEFLVKSAFPGVSD